MDPLADTLRRLREAFSAGRTRSPEFRAAQLKGLGRFLQENKQLLQEALAQDLHKSVFEAETSELLMCQNEVDLALKNLHNWMKDEPVAKNLFTQLDSAFIQKEPFGLVLIIAPWNYPVNLPLVLLVGALATGNCVVLKPSELSKSTEKVLAEVLPQYLDQSCFAVVLGGPQETRQPLEHQFDYIFFPGSPRVGRIVVAVPAKHLTPVTLELGGKNPCYVDDDCDPQTVANRVAWFRYFNCGQTCVAPDYVLCSPHTRERLLPALQSAITRFYGEDPRRSPSLGRVVSDKHFRRLRGLLGCGRVAIGGQSDEDERSIGNSGIGRYHGKFSFDTSHHRASLLSSSGLEKLNELHYPPYTAHSQKLITWVLGSHSQLLGPKASGRVINFALDPHTTAASMGTCLITEAVHKVSAMHLCHYLLVALPPQRTNGRTPAQSFCTSCQGRRVTPKEVMGGLGPQDDWSPALELGPQPQGPLQADMRTLVAEVLDFIELFNQVLGTSMAFPAFEMEANRTVGSVDFARTESGDLAGTAHPQLPAQDSQPRLPGMPISQMFSDEDVLSEGESTVYPVFINEAAYYENGMAVIQIEKLHSVPALPVLALTPTSGP
ncbi:LOW QUALITY PROTEIN: aldehyde dehydrogenase family 3 member B1-like [Lycaon pictus]